MKILLLPAFLISTCFMASAQNLIGYNGQEIKKFMKENRKDMNFDKVTNTKFLYLKYSDNYNSQTLLFFLNSDSVCKSVRIICDESVKAEKVKEYNSIYKKNAENNWIDTQKGRDYLIELRDDEWASVITMKLVK